ncbi:MAG: aminotransferase class III-fold pyridoxal phosphate-dependent enzyme, partial [Pseudomonadota bacterium]
QKLEGLVASHPDVFEEVRGVGLMLGLKCRVPNTEIVNAAYDAHVLTVPAADNVVRILPALNIGEVDLAEAVNRLDMAATKVKAHAA